MLHNGIYEQVINKRFAEELADVPETCKDVVGIDKAESSSILSQYLADIVRKGLDNLLDKGGDISGQVNLVNKIIELIKDEVNEPDFSMLCVEPCAKMLHAVYRDRHSDDAEKIKRSRPETSVAHSCLFTGAVREPQMFTELKKEILSCSKIDMLVSFVKWSGLRLIFDELKEFTENGGKLRIITTSYMGATDIKAIEELRTLPNTEIKVSYDTERTRLHAKTYVFYRDTGFSTAYVGSSNLSNAAISSGLEWNMKVTRVDLPEIIDKIEATFESYWNSNEFEYYTEQQQERLARALKAEKYSDHNNPEIYTVDVRPYSYQQEILDKLQAERMIRGYMRNLIVAATGTGKTVISALDYKQFRKQNLGNPCRLLFVAHREEILKQSMNTFRAVLKDANFGEMFVGGYKPDGVSNLFISIQTFNSQALTEITAPDFYDYIVVDEFHHAAAPSYQKLLKHYKPKILLGMTATPERMDGRSILQYFDNRIAAEIRLPEAIDRKLLCPFQYFGVTDSVSLKNLSWSAGGYDKTELSDLYTVKAEAVSRADAIVRAVLKYTADMDKVKGIGFCVTVKHAEFMCRYFNEHNIPAMFLTGTSSDEERGSAKHRLVSGEVRFIFVVDIYNEGVDIPEINTVLFLRPTESLTVFLQQLGRGLRLADDKECLTVLDFIGMANKKYNFEEKFAALLSNTTRSVEREMEEGFISVPKGCYIQLEKEAEKYILENIRASYRNSSAGLISRISSFKEDTGQDLSLKNFLSYYRLDPREIYKFSTFSRLCVCAGTAEDFSEHREDVMRKAFARFAVVDSSRWINFLLDVLTRLENVNFSAISDAEKRMMQMFYITIWGKTAEDWNSEEVNDNLRALAGSPRLLGELVELLQYRLDQIDHFSNESVDVGFDCPLELHCSYTRDQLLVALDLMNPNSVREGVKWLRDKNIDVFFITLNKSDKDYSPTTMYNDYSINENLFHWQSQSTTSESSDTGQRYIHHAENGSRVLLFVREFKKDSITQSACAYTYLGTANYERHEGEKPMNIIWRLDHRIPAKYFKKTNSLLVG